MAAFNSVGLLLCFVGSGAGLRKASEKSKAQSPLEMSASPGEYVADSRCFLAGGFDLQKGCWYPAAFMPVPDCDDASFDEACEHISNAEDTRGYLRDIRSTSDYSSLARTVVQAEGGGFGVKVSGGLGYMKESQVTETSLAFFIGLGGRTQLRTLRRAVALKLTSPAKDLLGRDPQAFIRRHGLRYIYGETLGGSFMGSFTLNSRQTADATDLQAFGSLSVTKGLFSASGSGEFQRKVNSANMTVAIHAHAAWIGGSGIDVNFSSPVEMANMFSQWNRVWRAEPKPLTITVRNWIDSAEVQDIVSSMSAEDQALFNVPAISRVILQEISTEDAKVALVKTSVDRALGWWETRNQPAVESCFTDLRRNIISMTIEVTALVEADIAIIQTQWLAGNFSWFRADSFEDQYHMCVELLAKAPSSLYTDAALWLEASTLPSGPVAKWQDLRGRGKALVQSTPSRAPVRSSGTSPAYVEFDGTDDMFEDLELQSQDNSMNLFWVVKANPINAYHNLIDAFAGALCLWVDTKNNLEFNNCAGHAYDTIRSSHSVGAWTLVHASINNGQSALYVDGQLNAQSGYPNPRPFGDTLKASHSYQFFNRKGRQTFSGKVAEMAIFPRALSEEERKGITEYMMKKVK